MGRAPKNPVDQNTKESIRQVYSHARRSVLTHNRDGHESPLEVLYRAASVVQAGGVPTNLKRRLPGGQTVGDILKAAGIEAAQ